MAGPAFEPSKQNSSAPPVPPPAVASASLCHPAGASSQVQPVASPSFEQRQFAVTTTAKPGAAERSATGRSFNFCGKRLDNAGEAVGIPDNSEERAGGRCVSAPATLSPPPGLHARHCQSASLPRSLWLRMRSTSVTQPVASVPAVKSQPVSPVAVAPAPIAVALARKRRKKCFPCNRGAC